MLARGTLPAKLRWAFSLYDINCDGVITKEEMLDIIGAIYDMMGRFSDPAIDENTVREHVDRVFEVRCDTISRYIFFERELHNGNL